MTRSVEEAISDIRMVRIMAAGKAQITAAQSELRRIDSEGPAEVKAYALSTMVEAFWYGGEKEKAYVPFSKSIAWYDEHPEWFDRVDRFNLFWSFKWMVDGLRYYPRVSLTQLESTLDDMQRRYALEGFSADAPAEQRWLLAEHCGNPDRQALFDEWQRQPRDEMSDCELCSAGDKIEFLLTMGRIDDALSLMEATIDDPSIRQECFSEPAMMYSLAQFAYLQRGAPGDTDKAIRAHHRCRSYWDETQDFGSAAHNPWLTQERSFSLTGPRARCIEFLARTGNADAAVRLIANNRRFLKKADSPGAQLLFLSRVGVALRVLVDDLDLGSQPVLTDIPSVDTIDQLWSWVQTEAEELAAAFDARNGTSHQTDILHEAWQLRSFPEPVDLRVVVELPPEESPLIGDALSQPVPSESYDDQIAEAESLVSKDEPAAAVTAYLAAADRLESVGQLSQAGFARAEAGYLALHMNDLMGAKSCLSRAVQLLRAAGTPPAFAAPVVTTLADCLGQLGETEEAESISAQMAAQLGDALDQLTTDNMTPDVAKARQDDLRWARTNLDASRARNLILAGHVRDGATLTQRVAQQFAELGLIEEAATQFQYAGMAWTGVDNEAAVWCLESAVEGYKMKRTRKVTSQAANLLVELLQSLGRDDEAAAVAADI